MKLSRSHLFKVPSYIAWLIFPSFNCLTKILQSLLLIFFRNYADAVWRSVTTPTFFSWLSFLNNLYIVVTILYLHVLFYVLCEMAVTLRFDYIIRTLIPSVSLFWYLSKGCSEGPSISYKVLRLLTGPRWVIIWYSATATCIISQNGFCSFLTLWSFLQKSLRSRCGKWRQNSKSINLHLIPGFIVLYKWPLTWFMSSQFVQTL